MTLRQTAAVLAAALAATLLPLSATAPVSAAVAPAAVAPTAVAPNAVAPTAVAPTAAGVVALKFRTSMTSTATELTTLPGGHVYGSNRLVGPTTWAGRRAKVVFLALVDYTDGSGPFSGTITVTRADGTRLGLTVDGHALALATSTGSTTRFSGEVSVVGGSGPYAGATGVGTMTGVRKADLGGRVDLTFTLTVRR